MRKEIIPTFGLGLLALLFSGESTASQPLIIAGLALGQPFTMPQCEKAKDGEVKSPPEVSCWMLEFEQWTETVYTPPRILHWAASDDPHIGSNWSVSVTTNGILTGVGYYTTGAGFEDRDLRQLTTKLGKPSSIASDWWGNMLGYHVKKITAEWHNNTVYATYQSCCLDADPKVGEGSVWIQTATSRAEELKRIEEEKREHPDPRL